MTPKELYTERIKTLTEEIHQLNRHNRLVVIMELSAIALAVGCVVGFTECHVSPEEHPKDGIGMKVPCLNIYKN